MSECEREMRSGSGTPSDESRRVWIVIVGRKLWESPAPQQRTQFQPARPL